MMEKPTKVTRLQVRPRGCCVNLGCNHVVYTIIKASEGNCWAHFIAFCGMIEHNIHKNLQICLCYMRILYSAIAMPIFAIPLYIMSASSLEFK